MKTLRGRLLGHLITAITIVFGLVWVFPIYWGINTSLSVDTNTILVPPAFFPKPMMLDAFEFVVKHSAIVHWYVNSVVTSVIIVVVVLLLAIMCAYALSQIKFSGNRLVFLAVIAGFMIPMATSVIPLFMFLNKFNLVNSYWGLILPQLVSPIAVVIYKQFFDQMPSELSDAAKIDGSGEYRILFRIFLPLNWGITWALAIVLFIWTWNNFFWPFIIINDTLKMTIPVGITQVQSWYGIAYPRQLASAVLAALPTAILYLIFQRRVAQGVAITSGIK